MEYNMKNSFFEFFYTKRWYIAYFILITTINFPSSLFTSATGLDASWVIGLHWSHLLGLQYGKDIIFTYGPLGFLSYPAFVDYHMFIESIFCIIAFFYLFYAIIFIFLNKMSAEWYHYALLLPLTILCNISLDYELLISAIIILYLLYSSKENSYIIPFSAVIAGILLSFASFIKFNAFFICLTIFLGSIIIIFLDRRKYLILLYSLAGFVITFPLFWVLSGQNPHNIIDFFITGFQITQGYTNAMSIEPQSILRFGLNFDIMLKMYAAIIIVSLIAVFICYSKTRFKQPLILLFLSAGFLFMAFKHGFVRLDLHILIFFSAYAFIIFFLFIIIDQGNNDKNGIVSVFFRILLIIILFSLLAATLIATGLPSLNGEISKYQSIPYKIQQTVHYIVDPNIFNERSDKIKLETQHFYNLNNSIWEKIENSPVDIIPVDIGLLWANDLNWSPRPIFQSYSTYTKELDIINSLHFEDMSSSPEYIVISLESIDNRYPVFDEPQTFRSIITHYSYLESGEKYIILKKIQNDNVKYSDTDLGGIEGTFGEVIKIPALNSGLVFGEVTIEKSFEGKIVETIYKPSPLTIQFILKNNETTPSYRFISSPAENGILLSNYFEDTSDLASFFATKSYNPISGFIITSPNPKEYSKKIKVHFQGVNWNNSTANTVS
jgi:hypothetical protein